MKLNTQKKTTAVISILIFVLAIVLTLKFKQKGTDSELDASIENVVAHMHQMIKADGAFEYEVDLVSGLPSQHNNIVRQAGAAFSLGENLQINHTDYAQEMLDKVLSRFIMDSVETREAKSLLSEDGTGEGAKVGATALAILAAVHFESATGDRKFAEARENWIQSLLSMRMEDRGFQSAPHIIRESPYFNGEGWLALARARRLLDIRSFDVELESLDQYLMNRYKKELDIGFFHWGVMAATERYLDTGEVGFIEFSELQGKNFLEERPETNPHSNSCYMIEGLASFVLAANKYPKVFTSNMLDSVKERINVEMEKNLRLQIKDSAIEFPSARVESDYLATYAGGFRNSAYSLKT